MRDLQLPRIALAGAQEFKKSFDEAVTKNADLLAADEAAAAAEDENGEAGAKDEPATVGAVPPTPSPTAADELASKVDKVSVADQDTATAGT